MSPIAIENLPFVVEHTTGPLTFCGWPPMVTFASPAAAAVLLDTVVGPELVVALDDVVVLDDGAGACEPPLQPAAPATIVMAPTATNNSCLTKILLRRW
ncbi:hypothetical protein MHAE_13860 [Mycobacterium haemophilum DSM 44634]